ncbi:ABC transporter ATP-binding protein [Kitasatospora sp. NPDC002227]|uniref:ABC transporter ATP-binding protein n=1 Tax=Kitasatospora sp. NPDC002227 TaxID=3154773 RepID=UPI003333B1F6
MCLGGLAPVSVAWAMGEVVDTLAHGRSAPGRLPGLVALVLGATLVAAVVPLVGRYAEAQSRRRIAMTMYDELFRAVNRVGGLSRFESPAHLDKVRLAQQAVQIVPLKSVPAVFSCVQSLVTAGGFLGTLLAVNPVLALAVLVSAVPTVVSKRALGRRRTDVQWHNSPRLRRQMFYTRLLTELQAIKEVRLYGLGDHLRERYLDETREINRGERSVDRAELRTESVLSLTGTAVMGAGMSWAVYAAAHGWLSVGTVTMFLLAIGSVQSSLGSFAGRIGDLTEAFTLFGSFRELCTAPSDLPVPRQPAAIGPLRTGIEFRDVWFRYGDDRPWILQGLDLTIPHGRTVALVGLNGAGKSTLIKLLCRLYDPTRGRILWDGVDIRDVDPAELRRRIGTVFQDYMTYDLTAAENVGLGDLPALQDRERIVRAAGLAGIDEVLGGLPRGYDTMLSRIFTDTRDGKNPQAGAVLSGGQWQRVALARGLMRDQADLLVLDEPSSGLDAEAEHDIHTRLVRHRGDRATLLVSHRLGAVREAHTIVVLADGRIVEEGTHESLMTAQGRYAALFELQAAGYRETSGLSGAR